MRSIEEDSKVTLSEPIATLIFTIVFIIIFNFFTELIQVRKSAGNACIAVNIFTRDFYQMIPFLTARWLLDCILAVMVIVKRERTKRIRIYELIPAGLDVGLVLFFLIQGVDHFISLEALADAGFIIFKQMFSWGFYITLLLILCFSAYEIIKNSIQLKKYILNH